MQSFFWLYLTINAADFRLFPLDRNTYGMFSTSHVGDLNVKSLKNYFQHFHWHSLNWKWKPFCKRATGFTFQKKGNVYRFPIIHVLHFFSKNASVCTYINISDTWRVKMWYTHKYDKGHVMLSSPLLLASKHGRISLLIKGTWPDNFGK